MLYPDNFYDSNIHPIWKRVSDYYPQVYPDILVNNYGRVYNGITGNLLPMNENYCKDKYINVNLMLITGGTMNEMLHRLVMLLFAYFPGCEQYEVNHKDGIKYHNWLSNLVWSTHQENIDHAYENNLFMLGEIRENSKLTNDQAKEICLLLESGMTPTEISKVYFVDGVNILKTATNILTRHCWKHISKDYNIDNARRR